MLWALHAAFWTHGTVLIESLFVVGGAFLLLAVWAFRWWRTGNRDAIIVPIASVFALLAPPGNWFYLNGSSGLLALAGSLILFAIGAALAWTRHRWDQKESAS